MPSSLGVTRTARFRSVLKRHTNGISGLFTTPAKRPSLVLVFELGYASPKIFCPRSIDALKRTHPRMVSRLDSHRALVAKGHAKPRGVPEVGRPGLLAKKVRAKGCHGVPQG